MESIDNLDILYNERYRYHIDFKYEYRVDPALSLMLTSVLSILRNIINKQVVGVI